MAESANQKFPLLLQHCITEKTIEIGATIQDLKEGKWWILSPPCLTHWFGLCRRWMDLRQWLWITVNVINRWLPSDFQHYIIYLCPSDNSLGILKWGAFLIHLLPRTESSPSHTYGFSYWHYLQIVLPPRFSSSMLLSSSHTPYHLFLDFFDPKCLSVIQMSQ